jgi:hypothetical protein
MSDRLSIFVALVPTAIGNGMSRSIDSPVRLQ